MAGTPWAPGADEMAATAPGEPIYRICPVQCFSRRPGKSPLAFDSLSPQHEPVLAVTGDGVVAAAEPHVGGDLAELVADVGEDRSVRRVLHCETGLAIEPTRFHAGVGGNCLDAAEPAVGERAVVVKVFSLPDNPLQASFDARVVAVGVQYGALSGTVRAALDGALTEKNLPATRCRVAEGRGRGAGDGRACEGEGRNGGEVRSHALL